MGSAGSMGFECMYDISYSFAGIEFMVMDFRTSNLLRHVMLSMYGKSHDRKSEIAHERTFCSSAPWILSLPTGIYPRNTGPYFHPPGKLKYPINRHNSVWAFTVPRFPFSTAISPPNTGLLSLSCCRCVGPRRVGRL